MPKVARAAAQRWVGRAFLSASLTGAFLAPTPGSAQESAAPERPAPERPAVEFDQELQGATDLPTEGVEEITITGEVLESTTQAAPEAITTFDQEELDTLGVVDVDSLALNTPSLHVGQVGQTAVITLRGIGLENLTSVGEAGVGFQIDGIHQGRPSASNATFFDLERVSVKRGPQGYEGGRNLTAGKIELWSKKPQEEFDAFGDVEIGNYEQIRGRMVVNAPFFEDKLMTRFSGVYTNRIGYQAQRFWDRSSGVSPALEQLNDLNGGKTDFRSGDADDLALRGQMRSLLFDQQAELRIIGNYSTQKGNGPALHLIGDPGSNLNTPTAFVANQRRNDDFFGDPLMCAQNRNPGFQPVICQSQDPNETWADFVHQRNNRATGATALFVWDSPYLAETPFSDLSFNIRTGWQQNIEDGSSDLDGTNIPDQRLDLARNSKQTQVEVFLERPDVGLWDFKAGFFYFEEDIDSDVCFDAGGVGTTVDIAIEGDIDTISYAGYARAGFRPFDNLRAYAAVRYTKEEKKATQINEAFDTFSVDGPNNDRQDIINGDTTIEDYILSTNGVTNAAQAGCSRYFNNQVYGRPPSFEAVNNPGCRDENNDGICDRGIGGVSILNPAQAAELTNTGKIFSAWTPAFGLEWQVSDTATLGFSATRGFKSGGFPLGASARLNPNLQDPYPSEFVWNFELTSKNDLFDGRMRLNITGFWTEYSPFQICQFSGPVFFCRGDGSATIRGIEVEWNANPIEGLGINGHFNFLNSRVNDFQLIDPTIRSCDFISVPCPGIPPTGAPPRSPTQPLPTNVEGNKLPKAPAWAGSFGVQYAFDFGRWGFVIPRFQTQFQGRTYFRVFNKKEFSQDPFFKVDLKLTWRSENSRFFFETFVSNLTDEDVINSMIVGPQAFGGQVLGQFQPPRTYGLRMGITYTTDWVDQLL